MKDQVVLAEGIARQAHWGQKEESTGDDYIHHIERVVALVEGDDAKAVAWLHDLIEDTPWSLEELRAAGVTDRVVDAVDLLTRWPLSGTPTASYDFDGRKDYASYINRILVSRNRLALDVKLADLHDHLRPNCPERLRPRYEKALIILGDARDPRPSEP